MVMHMNSENNGENRQSPSGYLLSLNDIYNTKIKLYLIYLLVKGIP